MHQPFTHYTQYHNKPSRYNLRQQHMPSIWCIVGIRCRGRKEGSIAVIFQVSTPATLPLHWKWILCLHGIVTSKKDWLSIIVTHWPLGWCTWLCCHGECLFMEHARPSCAVLSFCVCAQLSRPMQDIWHNTMYLSCTRTPHSCRCTLAYKSCFN